MGFIAFFDFWLLVDFQVSRRKAWVQGCRQPPPTASLRSQSRSVYTPFRVLLEVRCHWPSLLESEGLTTATSPPVRCQNAANSELIPLLTVLLPCRNPDPGPVGKKKTCKTVASGARKGHKDSNWEIIFSFVHFATVPGTANDHGKKLKNDKWQQK